VRERWPVKIKSRAEARLLYSNPTFSDQRVTVTVVPTETR
jgi:vacuolar-type H+-ATPase catalytic subunit A/Vma1